MSSLEEKLPAQIQSIISDMWRAFDVKLYYPSLVVALTLPEICVSLSLDSKKFVKGDDYKQFVERYVDISELGMDGDSCYKLRGGVIHRGNAAGHPYFGSSHVIFSVPETQRSVSGISIGGIFGSGPVAAMFDLENFCRCMDSGVRKWFGDHSKDRKVLDNLPGLLSWRPNGLPPFFSGTPVLGSGAEDSDERVALRCR